MEHKNPFKRAAEDGNISIENSDFKSYQFAEDLLRLRSSAYPFLNINLNHERMRGMHREGILSDIYYDGYSYTYLTYGFLEKNKATEHPIVAVIWAVEIPFEKSKKEFSEKFEAFRYAAFVQTPPKKTSSFIREIQAKIGNRKILYLVELIRDRDLPIEDRDEALQIYREMYDDFLKFVIDHDFAVVSEYRSKTSYKKLKREESLGIWEILADIEMPDYLGEKGDEHLREDAHLVVHIPKKI